MKLTYHDKFALLPKRCDYCNKLFIFEPYNIAYKLVGIGYCDLRLVKCKKCVKKV